MITSILKLSEIKKDPVCLLGWDRPAAITRYGDIVAYVVSPKRMNDLLNAEKEINYFSKSLEDMINEMHSSGRINYDVYQELFGLL